MQLKNLAKSIFEDELLEKLSGCKTEFFQKGETIIRQEFYATALPIVLSGNMRVFRKTAEKEILLYYVQPGETCIVTLISFFEQKKSYVEVAASDSCEVIFVPFLKAVEWQRLHSSWNNFVLKTFFHKNNQLLTSINDLAFASMDKRVKNHLLRMATGKNPGNMIRITHQELANELGTSRVVISRILKSFESEGLVKLLRGAIKLQKLSLMQ